ncbi:MAG: protein translocase subunit SecF [Rickettsiales bacterium]|jgi:preprotein translocase subunit SecF|nr:protein translocase subunit SecF [Rickettsiales bacterium]
MTFDFKFMKYRKLVYAVSVLLILGAVASLVFKGLNYGIDFSGGIAIDAKPAAGYQLDKMRGDLAEWNPELQADDKGNVLIRVGLDKNATEAEQNARVAEIKKALGDRVSYQQVQIVGPKIGGELIRGGIMAIVFAFLMMAVYVWIRYRGGYAVGSFLALSLDFFLMFGFYSIAGLEFSQTAIAVILTGIGYSINDKIVNYDRIEENAKKYKTMPTDQLIDLSVNEMFVRTQITSVSTALGMMAMLIFAGGTLGDFALAMLFSIFEGTLSSIFVSNALLMNFNIREK